MCVANLPSRNLIEIHESLALSLAMDLKLAAKKGVGLGLCEQQLSREVFLSQDQMYGISGQCGGSDTRLATVTAQLEAAVDLLVSAQCVFQLSSSIYYENMTLPNVFLV